jgi:pimeloyl-ACP methyl ester carboxylesterase
MVQYVYETVDVRHVEGESATFGYRELGEGDETPLVLLHRFRGTLDDWDPKLLDLLAAERRVIAFDNVGVGYTDGVAPDSVAEMADGVADFFRAMEIDRADVLGWSMGGFVAQMFALNHASLVRKLVVAGSGPGEPSIRPPEPQRSLDIRKKEKASIEDAIYQFYPDDDQGRQLGIATRARLYHHQSGVVKTVAEPSWQNQALAINRWNSGENSAFARLGELDAPTFVANGADDVMEHSVQSYEMALRLPNAITTIFSHAGHAFLFQDADLFAQLTHAFLDAP